MRILSLRDKKTPTPTLMAGLLAEHGVTVTDHSPTLLSAFASMRIASIIDKEDIDVVEARCVKDAVAALSARKLARKKDVRVIMNVAPNSEPPKSVPADVRRGVDAWIFPGERLLMAFPQDFSNAVVIPTTSFLCHEGVTNSERRGGAPSQQEASSCPVISWIGDIARPDKLKAYFEEAEAAEGDFVLRVCGAGKAALVMPVVRFSRHLTRNKDIQWAGEKYDVAAEIAGSDAVLATGDDITDIEAAAVLSGRPLLQTGDLAAFLAGTHKTSPKPPGPGEYISRYAGLLRSL